MSVSPQDTLAVRGLTGGTIVADNGSQSDRDEYSRRARYMPGLLMLAPIGVVVAAAGWQDARIVTVLTGVAVTVGLPFVLESFVRQQGLRFEVTELEGSSGMWTTTQMLWPMSDDPAEAARNAENRRVIERVTDRPLPSSIPANEGEQAAVAAAFDEAVADVRAVTRSSESYPILRAENAEYGMWRNLRGVRTYGRVLAAMALIVAIVFIVLSLSDVLASSTGELVVGALAVAGLLAFWWVIPTEQRIRQASQRYALALFDAARLLGRSADVERSV